MFHEGDSFGTMSRVWSWSILSSRCDTSWFLPGVLSFLLERKILGHYWQLENVFVWTWNEVLEILTWKRNLSGPWLVKSIFYAICSGVSTPPLMSHIWNSSLNPVFLISGAMFSIPWPWFFLLRKAAAGWLLKNIWIPCSHTDSFFLFEVFPCDLISS